MGEQTQATGRTIAGASVADIKGFLASHRVGAVLMAEQPPRSRAVPRLARATGVASIRSGRVVVFQLPTGPGHTGRPRYRRRHDRHQRGRRQPGGLRSLRRVHRQDTHRSGWRLRAAGLPVHRPCHGGRSSGYRAEPGRYHLYVSLACPWAHRSVIVRRLVGLEDVVSISAVDPVRDGRGWAFREGPGYTCDPVNGFTLIRQAYDATEPGYDGHISVPVLWDRRTSRIVSNNFPDITIDLETQFGQWATPGVDLYPLALRPEIDALNERVYTDVNNGVYQCGFAATQAAYDGAVARLFTALDDLDRRLATRRYLFGDALTEADVRLWVTLARFDPVYVTHFKANMRRLADYPNLWPYARDLYQQPAFGGTTDFDHIKRHYFGTHPRLNPSRIVPAGPLLNWQEPHHRERRAA